MESTIKVRNTQIEQLIGQLIPQLIPQLSCPISCGFCEFLFQVQGLGQRIVKRKFW